MPEVKPYPPNKEVGDISSEMKEESPEKKREAAKDILKFVLEMVDDENINIDLEADNSEAIEKLTHPEKILESFIDIDFDQFKTIIDNINARANRVSVNSDEQRSEEAMTYGMGVLPDDQIFPTPERNEEIWKDTFETIQGKLKEEYEQKGEISEDTAETVALTVFNLIGDTHVYKNGNGRTSRALYFMLSTKTNKNPESYISDFTDVVSKKNGKGNTSEVDSLFKRMSYMSMLLKRGLNPTLHQDRAGFYSEVDEIMDNATHDTTKIKFLAAYDVLKENPKFELDDFMDKLEGAEFIEGHADYALPFVDNQDEVPSEKLPTYQVSREKWREINTNDEYSDLSKEIEKKAEEIREEEVRKIIDISLNDKLQEPDADEDDFRKHVYQKLTPAFEVDNE